MYTHNITNLVKLTGLKLQFDQDRAANRDLDLGWVVVENWTEASRYESRRRKDAVELFSAIADPANGVLECIKQYW